MSKVIIITGASRGLGNAIAKAILELSPDHKVFLVSRSLDELHALQTHYGADRVGYKSLDLTNLTVAPEIMQATVKAFGRIDGIVINHGSLAPISRISDADAEAWRRAYDINVFSPVALVQAAIPELRKTKGRVIFLSSGASTNATVGWGAYGTSKAALNHFCAHLAAEEPDITAVAVSPGKVDTVMQKLIREEGHTAMTPDIHASFVQEHETGRLLRPDQPGTVIAKMAIDATSALSGKHLRWNAAELADFQSH